MATNKLFYQDLPLRAELGACYRLTDHDASAHDVRVVAHTDEFVRVMPIGAERTDRSEGVLHNVPRRFFENNVRLIPDDVFAVKAAFTGSWWERDALNNPQSTLNISDYQYGYLLLSATPQSMDLTEEGNLEVLEQPYLNFEGVKALVKAMPDVLRIADDHVLEVAPDVPEVARQMVMPERLIFPVEVAMPAGEVEKVWPVDLGLAWMGCPIKSESKPGFMHEIKTSGDAVLDAKGDVLSEDMRSFDGSLGPS